MILASNSDPVNSTTKYSDLLLDRKCLPGHSLHCTSYFIDQVWFHDNSSTDTSSTDISSTTVYQRVGQLYIQLLFQQIIIFINSNFYLHYDSSLSIPLSLKI